MTVPDCASISDQASRVLAFHRPLICLFEEVTVKTVDATVEGPTGPVEGAIVGQELHQDGWSHSGKTFAPGYGEFHSAHEGDVEAKALAVPTDALGGAVPAELEALSTVADEVVDAIQSEDWRAAAAAAESTNTTWEAYRSGQVPPRIAGEMRRALAGLGRAVGARNGEAAATAAIDVAQSALDLELRHRPPAEIGRARFELWVRQLLVDAKAQDAAGVRGDLATLEWIRDRFAGTLDAVDLTRMDARLVGLRTAVSDENLSGCGRDSRALPGYPRCDRSTELVV